MVIASFGSNNLVSTLCILLVLSKDLSDISSSINN
jgi:hypothetical protein